MLTNAPDDPGEQGPPVYTLREGRRLTAEARKYRVEHWARGSILHGVVLDHTRDIEDAPELDGLTLAEVMIDLFDEGRKFTACSFCFDLGAFMLMYGRLLEEHYVRHVEDVQVKEGLL